MRRFTILLATIMAAAFVLGSGQDLAASWKSKKGKSKGRYEEHHEARDCDDRFRSHKKDRDRKGKHHGKKSKRHGKKGKCRDDARYSSGPPPWAPAHGYRAKRRNTRTSTSTVRGPYVPPFDLSVGKCNRTALGAVLGAGAGAAIGSQIGKGDGRTVAILGGTILGMLVGGNIGQMMDDLDQNCVGQALEHAPDGQAIMWNDTQSGAQYQVAPVKTIQTNDGRYCREYTATATVGGQQQKTYGMACRQADGSWQIQS